MRRVSVRATDSVMPRHCYRTAIATAILVALVGSRPLQQVRAQGYAAEEAVAKMTITDGFQVDLIAAEPVVRQPVAIDFDDRGRLWVLQYLQYPNPAGLKRVSVDRYSRTKYDRIPKPPPHGPKGADRLTILASESAAGRRKACLFRRTSFKTSNRNV